MPLAPILRPLLLLPLLGIMTRTVRRRQADASIWAENNCRTTVCCMCNREAFDHLITYDGLRNSQLYIRIFSTTSSLRLVLKFMSLRLTWSETVSTPYLVFGNLSNSSNLSYLVLPNCNAKLEISPNSSIFFVSFEMKRSKREGAEHAPNAPPSECRKRFNRFSRSNHVRAEFDH